MSNPFLQTYDNAKIYNISNFGCIMFKEFDHVNNKWQVKFRFYHGKTYIDFYDSYDKQSERNLKFHELYHERDYIVKKKIRDAVIVMCNDERVVQILKEESLDA